MLVIQTRRALAPAAGRQENISAAHLQMENSVGLLPLALAISVPLGDGLGRLAGLGGGLGQHLG